MRANVLTRYNATMQITSECNNWKMTHQPNPSSSSCRQFRSLRISARSTSRQDTITAIRHIVGTPGTRISRTTTEFPIWTQWTLANIAGKSNLTFASDRIYSMDALCFSNILEWSIVFGRHPSDLVFWTLRHKVNSQIWNKQVGVDWTNRTIEPRFGSYSYR